MPVGTIKKLVTDRGFGFIIPDGERNDVFFHAKGVNGGQFDALEEGQRVRYEMDESADRPRAIKVEPA